MILDIVAAIIAMAIIVGAPLWTEWLENHYERRLRK